MNRTHPLAAERALRTTLYTDKMQLILLAVALVGLTQVWQVEAVFGLTGLLALKAGAIGFGLGKAIGRGGFGRRRGYYGGGYGGYGHGHGYGYGHGYGHGYGRRRYHRDLSAVSQQQLRPELDVGALQMDAYFAAVQLGDEDGCGLKLVCGLHAMDRTQLGKDENMILALFGSDVPTSHRANSPKMVYDAAAELGRRAGTAEVCAETFSNCSKGFEALIEAISTPTEQ